MSHITCPRCGSQEHMSGYGFAAGPMGAYTFCGECDELLEFTPDTAGLDDEEVERVTKMRDEYMKKVWGDKP